MKISILILTNYILKIFMILLFSLFLVMLELQQTLPMFQVIYYLYTSICLMCINYFCIYLEKRDPDIVIRADNDENLMSFEKSQYTDSKENGSPIIFDFKDDTTKVSLNC